MNRLKVSRDENLEMWNDKAWRDLKGSVRAAAVSVSFLASI